MTIRLRSVGVTVYRVPVTDPVLTSFGVLRDRTAVVLHLRDDDGMDGWGEVWCNFPQAGPEHRARLCVEAIAPLALDQSWETPGQCFEEISRRLHVLALQSGEPGPIAQCIAGLDVALWDLWGKRRGEPLWRLLGGRSGEVRVYASGINPTQPERIALERRDEGHRAFKLKVGFGRDRDRSNLQTLREALGDSAILMVDANQAWTPAEAMDMARELAGARPLWIEEPIPADESLESWRTVAAASPIPLAAGENLRGQHFERFLASGALGVIQPDVAKWGGLSRCLDIAKSALSRGVMFCPHWLGGGIGLAATLHLKAAAGGDGFAEVDANANPLREALSGRALPVRDGRIQAGDQPGLGVSPRLEELASFVTYSDIATSRQS
ncbi:MAG: mandelate racemase/muconate lactonizing enzyme family protein [Pseudomonadota bacterium]